MIEEGVKVGTPAEDHGVEITGGPAEDVEVESIVLGVDDAVVGESTGVDVLDVEGTTASGVLCFLAAFMTGGFTGTMAAGDVVDATGGVVDTTGVSVLL